MRSGDTISAKIFRYDPTVDERPRYETVEVPFEKDMRVLDVLDYAVDNLGLGVGYRWFCGVKRCGMCGVSVNGKAVLACWEAAKEEMVIEPLANFPVIRDLVVDRSRFEKATAEIKPFLIRSEPYDSFPEAITHTEMEDAFKLMNCIECYVCTGACPVLSDADHKGFAGPGTLVQLAKVALNPLDGYDRVPLALKAGIDACVSCYECSHVCPVGINVLEDAIEKLKRICAAHSEPGAGARHARIFADNVRERGRVHPATVLRKTKGWKGSLERADMGLKMYLKGKVSARAETLPRVDEIRTIFDTVEKKK